MKKLENSLFTEKYTEVHYEKNFANNAPHYFEVRQSENYTDRERTAPLLNIKFQEGPIKESGVNGVMDEDLLAMVITRLEHFQESEFRCQENFMALLKLEEAALWLRKRTMGREDRGVEGTHRV